jgi:mannose-6-phosphate isomerase-like protein (cupin superfamily)
LADVTVKRTEDFEAIFGGGFRRVRAGLGVSSFGLAVIDLPANFERYPSHTHGHDGQEEVYTVLSGRAILRVGGEDHVLEPGVWARVGPDEKRKLLTESEPARIAAIGGMPDRVYVAPEYTNEGAADPVKAKNLEKEPVAPESA